MKTWEGPPEIVNATRIVVDRRPKVGDVMRLGKDTFVINAVMNRHDMNSDKPPSKSPVIGYSVQLAFPGPHYWWVDVDRDTRGVLPAEIGGN